MNAILGVKPKKVHPVNQQAGGHEDEPMQTTESAEIGEERNSAVIPRDEAASKAMLEDAIRPKHLRQLPSLWRLMRETGFFNYFAVSNTFLQMTSAIGKEAKDVSKSTWTTMGIVSALLTAVSLGPLSAAVTTVVASYDGPTDLWEGNWRRCILYLSVLSFLCNISVVLMTVLLYILIDHCFTEDHVQLFILDWIGVIILTPCIFSVGVVLTLVTVIASIAVTSSSDDFWILLAVILTVIVLLFYLAVKLILYVGRAATVDALNKYHQAHDGMDWYEWKEARKKAKKAAKASKP
jgi:hypothetical protein